MSDKVIQQPENETPMFSAPPNPLDKIKDIKFEKNKDPKYNFSRVYTDYIPVSSIDALDERTQKREQLEEYFSELAKHLEIQARIIYKNIDVLHSFVESVVTNSSNITKNILESTDKYKEYLTTVEEDGVTVNSKPVMLAIKIAITNGAIGQIPMLVWIITSHSWEKSKEDETKIYLTGTIELLSE